MITPYPGPLDLRERFVSLDVLRGFALLGILVMNLPGFANSFWLGADGSVVQQAWWDRQAAALVSFLFSGKFNGLFTLLFAVGLSLQLERLRDVGALRERLAWLFMIGLGHALFLWHGDVLHMYALLGLLLLPLRRAPSALLIALFLLTLLWVPARAMWRHAHWDPAQAQAWVQLWLAHGQADNAVFGGGSWWATVQQRLREMVFFYTHPSLRLGLVGSYVGLLSAALVGLWLARHDWLTRPQRLAPQLWRTAWTALGLGLGLGFVYALLSPGLRPTDAPGLARTAILLCHTLSRMCLMVFYALALAQLAVHPRCGPWLQPLAVVGRMPLTQYLLQSLLCAVIFQGWGLGQWGRWGPAALLGLSLAVYFGVQLPLACWWLARFRFGPLEYLWRRASYGAALVGSLRRPPIRPAANA